MYFWNVLEIEPTKDKQKIKEAYARLSKKYHPEENPEKFKEIHSAYKSAISYSKVSEKKDFISEDTAKIINLVNENEFVANDNIRM